MPSFESDDWEAALKAYRRCRVVLLRGCWKGVQPQTLGKRKRTDDELATTISDAQTKAFKMLSQIPRLCASDIDDSWNLELPGDTSVVVPSAVLGMHGKAQAGEPSSLPRRFYSSFILKNEESVEQVMTSLPLKNLPSIGKSPRLRTNIRHGKAVWFFVGHNKSRRTLPGRPEHTDAVKHDGTWHFQVCGSKIWNLRPASRDLAKYLGLESEDPEKCRTSVCVKAGEVLLVDTRQWWHHTELPCTTSAARQLSVSYARDVRIEKSGGGLALDGNSNRTAGEANNNDEVEEDVKDDDMCNVDWLYAPHDIPCGAVVLTEDDVPDAELPESAAPNCEVAENEHGKAMLVATRDIQEGEFFSVPLADSSDESAGELETSDY